MGIYAYRGERGVAIEVSSRLLQALTRKEKEKLRCFAASILAFVGIACQLASIVGFVVVVPSDRGRERGVGAPSRARRKRRGLPRGRERGAIRRRIRESDGTARNQGGRKLRRETTKHENQKNS